MGPERKSRLISDEEKRIIAYHEAGHAVVMNAIPEADPVQKMTIVGRGQAGGVTWYRPEEDRVLTSRKKMIATLARPARRACRRRVRLRRYYFRRIQRY